MYSPWHNKSRLLARVSTCFIRFGTSGLTVSAVTLVAACAALPPPYVPAYPQRVTMARCFDGIPHMPGAKPWILGGTCCCTPTPELMEKLHADGLCLDLDFGELEAMYHEKGIHLSTDDHQNCGNLCAFGPHVVKGGHCMAPPAPGTRNYQEIVTGITVQPSPQRAK